MPIIFNIPDRYQSGIGIVLNLKEDDFNEFLSNLNSVNDAYTLRDLINQITKENKNIPENDIKEIVFAIKSLVDIIEQDDITPEEIVDDVFNVIEKGQAQFIEYKNQDKDTFKKRLIKLIQIKAISYTSKAYDIITSNQNSFISARVITDIRPIFGENVNDSPKVISVVHNLKLHYEDSECSEHKNLYITLDNSDIQTLKELFERAENKEKSINEMFKDTNIRIVSLERSK